MNFACPACTITYMNTSNLNKHLQYECTKYTEWIKTYKPRIGIMCNNCNLVFIQDEYLKEHEKHCKNKNIKI